MNFSPCLDIFFEDLPFAQRLETVASLGYKQYEFWTWWDKDMIEIFELSQQLDLEAVAYCTRFISLVDKSRKAEYLDGLGETIENATKTNTGIIISQVGDELSGVAREEQIENMIEGLRAASELLGGTDIVLAIEPLNTIYDHTGYFLFSSAETVRIVQAVDSVNVRMLFDIYHQQIMEGNLINNISKHIDYIAHFHIADVPGRHEIGTGEINFPNVLKVIDQSSYRGSVGIELFPVDSDHWKVLSNPLLR